MATSEQPSILAFWRWKLHWQVLIGILLGLTCGYLSGSMESTGDALASRWDMRTYSLLGELFMRALNMLIVPLVMCSIISSMSSMGKQQGFARMGGSTLLYYVVTSTCAILIGLVLVNSIQPGVSAGINMEEMSAVLDDTGSMEAQKMKFLAEKTSGKDISSTLNIFKEMIPSNIFEAMFKAQMLGLILFSLLVGFFAARLEGFQKEIFIAFFEGGYKVMMKMTFLVLRFLPLGVLCLIAKTTADSVAEEVILERIEQLWKFAVTVLLGLGMHMGVVIPLLLLVFAKVNPFRFFKAMGPALLTAFSTASSSATLPLTLECVEDKAGVSKRVSGFVLPLGATVNMDGTALYECVAVMFMAQLSGISLDFSAQLLVVVLALLTSIGVAGIPSASLVAIVIILNTVNVHLPAHQQIPMTAFAVIMVFDRLLDMCRTAVNIASDSCGAIIIAKREGEVVLATEID